MNLLRRVKELLARYPGGRAGGALTIAVAAGLALGFLLVPKWPAPNEQAASALPVQLFGRELALDARAPATALERIRAYVARRFVLELPDGKRREVYLGELGAEIDKLHLTELVRAARDQSSPVVRAYVETKKPRALELPVPVRLSRDVALPKLAVLKDELDRAPADARLDLDRRALVPEVNGRFLDIDATLFSIDRALEAGASSARLVFAERRAKRTVKELSGVAFDAVLGWFETRYDRSEKYAARSYNLRIAASKLDGHVLLPGETFDFNEVVGPRDEANGYKVAPVIAEGELVDGIGGGTCQISGTLHGAAFFAGLEVVERYPHTRPSSYIKLGLDATVVYPTINFRMKNTFPFPVVIHQTVKNGVVRAEILGPRRLRTVTLIRRVLEAIPYEEVERPDKALPSGERLLSQRGVAGFKIRRYRITREGPHATRERWDDVYPPTQQIVRVGTGELSKAAKTPEDDPHPEYLADELLVVTQGPDTSDQRSDARDDDKSDGSMSESREPGRYGEEGWTEKAGMPYWRNRAKPPGNEEKPKTSQKKGGKA